MDVELIFTDKSCFRDESPKVNGYGGDALQLARNGQKMQMRTDRHVRTWVLCSLANQFARAQIAHNSWTIRFVGRDFCKKKYFSKIILQLACLYVLCVFSWHVYAYNVSIVEMYPRIMSLCSMCIYSCLIYVQCVYIDPIFIGRELEKLNK